MRVLVTRSRTGARSTLSDYLLPTEDVRIDPNEGPQEYHVMLQDLTRRCELVLRVEWLLSDTLIRKALLEII